MSIFRPVALHCPACNTALQFEAVHSVNADTRPELRAAIVDNAFQQESCPSCGAGFRLDPQFNLVDTGRGEWIVAAPLARLLHWQDVEQQARALFEHAYGAGAPDPVQEVGRALRPRVTFGWPALREKLLAHDLGIDDVSLELCKAYIMRNVDSPVSAESELRLLGADTDALHLTWLSSADGAPGPALKLARSAYAQIAADEDGDWDALRETLSAAYFVDINRLLMADS